MQSSQIRQLDTLISQFTFQYAYKTPGLLHVLQSVLKNKL